MGEDRNEQERRRDAVLRRMLATPKRRKEKDVGKGGEPRAADRGPPTRRPQAARRIAS